MSRLVARGVAAVAVAAAAGAGGFALGRAAAGSEAAGGKPESSVRAAAPVARQIAAEMVELALPRIETEGLLLWRGIAIEIERSFARRGLALDLGDEAGTLARLAAAGSPEEMAALLDGRAAIEHAADRPAERDALTRLARALDPDPLRDSVRAPLLANDAAAVRLVAADLAASPLPLRTALLLGAALLRSGDVGDALDLWRAASTDHPQDVAAHLLLAWRLVASDPPGMAEARRHLHAAHALLPGSAAVRARLEAIGG